MTSYNLIQPFAMSPRIIDHIVYSVLNLEKAMDDLEVKLGIRPTFGGYHKSQGTKNALLNLGNDCYLEILAIDRTNKDIKSPRWMGVDLITEPKITRWAIKSEDIKRDSQTIKRYDKSMGEIFQGSRVTGSGDLLAWKMILPLANPDIELIPFMVDWSDSAFHPTEKIREKCKLLAIDFVGNDPDKINQVFKELCIQNIISKSVINQISITIECPNGIIILK